MTRLLVVADRSPPRRLADAVMDTVQPGTLEPCSADTGIQ